MDHRSSCQSILVQNVRADAVRETPHSPALVSVAGVSDVCSNIAKNPRRPVVRFLNHEELERLGAALDRLSLL